MASSIPSQARAVDPFASYNSNTVNTLTRMLTYGENGLATALSCDVVLDATSNQEVVLQPGFVYQDDVWINIDANHVVDFDDQDQYYNFDISKVETGIYYIVLEYTYAKSRPAPEAKVLIVQPDNRGAYSPGGSWLFLKAVEVDSIGPINISAVYNFDPENLDNKRLFIQTFAGTEVGLPSFLQERDQSRIAYGIEEDDFFFGFSDRWVSLGGASGASYPTDTIGFEEGDLIYVTSGGNLSKALATLSSSTADGVVRTIGANGLVQTVGLVNNVKVETGSNITVGKLVYLSKTEPGSVSDQQSAPFSQFTGRCVEVIDSTSVNILFHRGEPQGSGGVSLAVSVPTAVLPAGGSWVSSGGSFYQDADISDFEARNCVVTVWDATSEMKIEPEDIEFVSDSVVRIWMSVSTENLEVYIIGPTATTIGSSYITSVVETLASGGSWLGGGPYYQDVDVSSLDGQSSAVLVKNTSTGEKIIPSDIQFDSTNNLRIWMPVNTETLEVTAVGSGPLATTTIGLSTILPSGGSWTPSGGLYFQDIDTSDFGSDDVVVELYDIDTGFRIEPTDIVFSASNMRVWMPDDTHNLNVTIIG